MNAEMLLDAMNLIHETYKKEAIHIMEHRHAAKKGLKKSLKIILIAAVLASLFTLSAFATGKYINSPAQAEKIAREEILKLQDMGLLSQDLCIPDGPANMVVELEEKEGDAYFFHRLFPHRYAVNWHGNSSMFNGWTGDNPYSFALQVDTSTGKLTAVTICANGAEDDKPIREEVLNLDVWDEETQQTKTVTETVAYYDNYDDIFPEDMTVGRFCSLLAEYWGFSGYTLSGTKDTFYGLDIQAPSEFSLLSKLTQDNYYLTVYFEGDQEGVPMYIQVAEFPGQVSLIVGTNHLVG